MQTGTGYGALNILTPSEGMFDAAQAQSARSRSQLEMATLPNKVEQSQLATTALREQGDLATGAYQDALLAKAAARIDPDDPNAAVKWRDAMTALAAKGNPVAEQLADRYSVALQKRITDAYSAPSAPAALSALQGDGSTPSSALGGAAGGAAGAAPDNGYAALVADKTPAQLQELQKSLAPIIDGARAVMASPDPVATFNERAASMGYPNRVQSPLEAISQAQNLLAHDKPFSDYLARRLIETNAGIPQLAPQGETKELGGILFERDPRTGEWKAKTPRVTTLGSGDQIVSVDPDAINNTAGQGPAAPTQGAPLSEWAKKMQGSENATGDPGAKNPRSSATGNGQFLGRLDEKGHGVGTWFEVMKNDPQFAEDIKGKSDAQILAMRKDPALADRAVQSLATMNAVALKASGHDVNGATLALAHRFGMEDAKDIMDASPDTPISSLVRPAVMRANPDLTDKATGRPKTAGEVAQQIAAKFGTAPVGVPGLAPGQSAPAGVPGVRILASGAAAVDDNNPLSDKAADYIAQIFVGTGKMPPMGMGKIATANRERVFNKAAEIEEATGSTGPDAVTRWATLKADTNALSGLSRQASMINAFEQTAVKNADQVLLLAPKGVGGSAPVLNRWINAGRRDVAGDPDVAKFNLAVGTLADEYAKVVSGGTGSTAVTDSARAEAYSRINGAMTVPQLQNVIAQMKIEMENRKSSLAEEQERLRGHIHSGGAEVAAGAANPAPAPGGGAPTPGAVAYQGGYPVLSPDLARAWAAVPGNKGKKFMASDGRVMAF